MKLNYRLIKISIIIMIIAVSAAVLFTFFLPQIKIILFLNNISLNIFAGAVVLFLTSIVEYYVTRKKDLEKLLKYTSIYINQFSKIKFLQETQMITYDQYKTICKKTDDTVEKILEISREHNEYNKNLINNFDDIIECYIRISEIDFTDFEDIYEDLRFILNNKQLKGELWEHLFEYIQKEYHLIVTLSFHLNNYKALGVSPVVIYDKIREYQERVFYEKPINKDDTIDLENEYLIKAGIRYQIIFGAESNLFVYNKISKNLCEQYDKIREIVYFKGDYSFIGALRRVIIKLLNYLTKENQ